MVLTIGHALRGHEALGRPDALPGLLEVVHSLFEDGVFSGHDQIIRVGILRSLGAFAASRKLKKGVYEPIVTQAMWRLGRLSLKS